MTGHVTLDGIKALVTPAYSALVVARDGVVFYVTLVKHLFAFHGVNGSMVKHESHQPILKT